MIQHRCKFDPRLTRGWRHPRRVEERDGPADTFGRRHIFAHVDRSEVAGRAQAASAGMQASFRSTGSTVASSSRIASRGMGNIASQMGYRIVAVRKRAP